MASPSSLQSAARRAPLVFGFAAVLVGAALLVLRVGSPWTGLSLLGAGVVALSLDHWWARRDTRNTWIPFLLGATVLLAGVVFWQGLRAGEDAAVDRRTALAARGARNEVEHRLEAMTDALVSLADSGSSAGAPRSLQDWHTALRQTFDRFPSLKAVEWIGPDGDMKLLGPGLDQSAGPRISAAGRTVLLDAAERTRSTGRPEVVGPFPAAGGGTAIRIVVPLETADGSQANLAGLFSVGDALADLLDRASPAHRVRVLADDQEVFAAGPAPVEPAGRWVHELPVRVAGAVPWKIEVSPGQALVDEERSGLPEIALATAVVVAMLLSLTSWFGEQAAVRARRFARAVAERTSELEAAKADAQAANAAKDHFLAMLAHELRNPLAGVSTALEVLMREDSADPERVTRMRRIARRQMKHMALLVDDLLDISRIERGKLSLRLDRLDLVDLVRDLAEAERARIEAAGLAFSVVLPDEPLWVDGDPTRLTQVVLNLLSNAAKFTDPGGRVEIRAAAEGPAGGTAVVTVRDTGAGLAPEELEGIFEPFAQTRDAIARAAGGLGLGLPIVKGLVEAHGGTIRAESEGHGRGATLTVHLPRREPPPPQAGEAPDHEAQEPARIVVIDDHPDTAEGLCELLGLFGHEVEAVRDGESGLEEIRRFRPDVVLCDLALPGELDGFQVAEILRSDPRTAPIRLVALTGYGDEETARRCRAAGFDEHLTKPVDTELLREVVAARPVRG